MLIAETGANAPRKKKSWLTMALIVCVGTLVFHANAKPKLPGVGHAAAPDELASSKQSRSTGRRRLEECTDIDNGAVNMIGQPC